MIGWVLMIVLVLGMFTSYVIGVQVGKLDAANKAYDDGLRDAFSVVPDRVWAEAMMEGLHVDR